MNESTVLTIIFVLLVALLVLAVVIGAVLFLRRRRLASTSDAETLAASAHQNFVGAQASTDLVSALGFHLADNAASECEVSPAIAIYRVLANEGNQPAALKVITPSALAQDAASRRKLEQQLAIAQSLNHPNCAKILASNARAATPFFVEEWLGEGSLQDYLRVGEALAEEDITHVVGQLCDALAYLHTRKLIHGFVTPGHVRFDEVGVAHLIHCGFAQLVGDRNKDPEAASASDLYSLGVIAFQMATGHMPFEGVPSNGAPSLPKQDPRRFNSSLTPNMADAIRMALSPERDLRFQNARDMARAFGYTRPFYGMQNATTVFTMPQPQVAAKAASSELQHRTTMRRSASGVLQLVNQVTGSTLVLQPARTILTRDLVNPADSMISRYNGELVYENNLWRLSELADAVSANGIFINEQRITKPRVLCYGDSVRVGTTTLRVQD
jgi:serine/threonine protein kinase